MLEAELQPEDPATAALGTQGQHSLWPPVPLPWGRLPAKPEAASSSNCRAEGQPPGQSVGHMASSQGLLTAQWSLQEAGLQPSESRGSSPSLACLLSSSPRGGPAFWKVLLLLPCSGSLSPGSARSTSTRLPAFLTPRARGLPRKAVTEDRGDHSNNCSQNSPHRDTAPTPA